MKKNIQHIYNKKSGFTLLFAVLVSTLVVSVGATIISIALRQTILSGTSRESQYAFYAANTALECAHYWDTTYNTDLGGKLVFPAPNASSTDAIDETDSATIDLVTCAGIKIITGEGNNSKAWDPLQGDGVNGSSASVGDETERTFYLKIEKPGSLDLNLYEYCAEATVTKKMGSTLNDIKIEAKGYNTCDITNPRRVERSLIQEYKA